MSVLYTCTSMQCTCVCACRACTCLVCTCRGGLSSALFCDFDFCPWTHKPNCPMRDSIKSYKYRRTNQCANGCVIVSDHAEHWPSPLCRSTVKTPAESSSSFCFGCTEASAATCCSACLRQQLERRFSPTLQQCLACPR